MDYTTVFEAILSIVTILITTFLVPYIRRKCTSEQIKIAEQWVDFFVKSADMLFTGSGRGEEKKAYVMEMAIEKLDSMGIKFDSTSLSNLIESKVYDIKSALEK